MIKVMSYSQEERFAQKVNLLGENGCWEWMAGMRKGKGAEYGDFQISNGQSGYAHRIAYQAWAEEVPDGLVLDHLCRNPKCVNPSHLEPVTRAENVYRGNAPAGINYRRRRAREASSMAGQGVHEWQAALEG